MAENTRRGVLSQSAKPAAWAALVKLAPRAISSMAHACAARRDSGGDARKRHP
ncbi:hypothetical protein AZA_46010 [Nitrospirillum viridazoti Y2]|nr:hypothetical protein AZA_46010 [Nitrospirillum amazonense Y2]